MCRQAARPAGSDSRSPDKDRKRSPSSGLRGDALACLNGVRIHACRVCERGRRGKAFESSQRGDYRHLCRVLQAMAASAGARGPGHVVSGLRGATSQCRRQCRQPVNYSDAPGPGNRPLNASRPARGASPSATREAPASDVSRSRVQNQPWHPSVFAPKKMLASKGSPSTAMRRRCGGLPGGIWSGSRERRWSFCPVNSAINFRKCPRDAGEISLHEEPLPLQLLTPRSRQMSDFSITTATQSDTARTSVQNRASQLQ